MPEDVIQLKNSTFIFRVFVLIESLHPSIKFFIFQKGVVLFDQVVFLILSWLTSSICKVNVID